MMSTLNLFLQQNSQKPTLTNDTKDKEYKPHDLPQRQSVQPVETCTIARRAKRTEVKGIHTLDQLFKLDSNALNSDISLLFIGSLF